MILRKTMLALLTLSLSATRAFGQDPSVSEPLLPSDPKECEAFSNDVGAARTAALSASNSCSSRSKAGQRVSYTNQACLRDLDPSVRDSMAFTCNRDRRCEAEDTKFYELLTYSREATASCYDKVRVYKAVTDRLAEWADQQLREINAAYRIAAETNELIEFTKKRDLELQQEVEARMAERLLESHRMAQAFHAEAMKEFYRQQGEQLRLYDQMMNNVSRQFAMNQQATFAAAAGSKRAQDTQILLMRDTLSNWRSAYSSGGCPSGYTPAMCSTYNYGKATGRMKPSPR